MLRGPFKLVAALLALGLIGAAVAVAFAPDDVGVVLPAPIERDLAAIVERDTLVALTVTNATSYFVYRGEAFGYEYELLKDFAEEAEVVIQMKVVPRDSLLYFLNAGLGDIAAARIVPAEQDTAHFAYTRALYETRPSVVQLAGAPEDTLPASVDTVLGDPPDEFADRPGRQLGEGGTGSFAEDLRAEAEAQTGAAPPADAAAPTRIRARLIERPAELAGETVFLPESHAYVDRLVEIEDQITGDIAVVEVDTSTEALVREVARGGIDLTVAPENVAELQAEYYGNLAVRPDIGPEHGVVWAVRENAPDLREALDRWIVANRDSRRWASLYRKYYVDRDGFRERAESRYLTSVTGELSPYDDVFRANAAKIGWDWRLLASQAFQESRFKPRARSWAGAMGLLQIMPLTARDLGIADPYDIEANVDGAVRYLTWLGEHYWDEAIPDSTERVKFVLASYNAGAGHVLDAQRLTEKYGGDKTRWEDVAYWMLRKSEAKWYNDPVVRHGYARGLEPVHYVAIILDRYEHYQQFVRDEPEGGPAPEA